MQEWSFLCSQVGVTVHLTNGKMPWKLLLGYHLVFQTSSGKRYFDVHQITSVIVEMPRNNVMGYSETGVVECTVSPCITNRTQESGKKENLPCPIMVYLLILLIVDMFNEWLTFCFHGIGGEWIFCPGKYGNTSHTSHLSGNICLVNNIYNNNKKSVYVVRPIEQTLMVSGFPVQVHFLSIVVVPFQCYNYWQSFCRLNNFAI